MDEDENYWSNLEQVFVHNVYERISSKYDEFLKLSQVRHTNDNDLNNNDVDKLINNENYAFKLKHLKSVYKKQIEKKNGNIQFKNNEWPKVRHFILQIEPYSLIADVGCGEGKYLNINSHILPIGSDRSSSLSQLASHRDTSNSTICNKNQVVICDNLYLPFRSNLFDAVISIGVIHHLSTPKRRIKAIQELVRILKPGGKIMIYVWAMEQRVRKFKSQDVLVPMLNTNTSSSKSEFKFNLRRDLSNNSAVNSEDSNDEFFTDKLLNSLNTNCQKNSQNYLDKCSMTSRSDCSSKDDSSSFNDETEKLDDQKFDSNEKETQSQPNTPTSFTSQKSNFTDLLRKFFSQKFSAKKEEPCENYSNIVKSSPHLITINSISKDPNVIEHYKKIIEDHKDLLPENFTIRQFPHSSCEDTFTENNDYSKINDENVVTDDAENSSNKRFYHVFRKNELDNIIREYCPELNIYDSFYDHGNWSVCALKVK
ncbi:unnamed protein product [Brachionus calyciflorus]|uniref:Methyltransferase type 11 domain-containing protein n=1 Tax=Brachionus calyciflorus TaxID=104777 RepID=A0A813M5E9_9BILA|nr:unnamed protein product [Brachionus calyciflorus]